DGVLLDTAYLQLECELERIVDGFGMNSLVAGNVVAAHVDEAAHREIDMDDPELLLDAPLLAYLYPGRYARITESFSFPFHDGFQR
ncbi:MAG: flavin reductase, partial [Planctomycetota bacterium]